MICIISLNLLAAPVARALSNEYCYVEILHYEKIASYNLMNFHPCLKIGLQFSPSLFS